MHIFIQVYFTSNVRMQKNICIIEKIKNSTILIFWDINSRQLSQDGFKVFISFPELLTSCARAWWRLGATSGCWSRHLLPRPPALSWCVQSSLGQTGPHYVMVPMWRAWWACVGVVWEIYVCMCEGHEVMSGFMWVMSVCVVIPICFSICIFFCARVCVFVYVCVSYWYRPTLFMYLWISFFFDLFFRHFPSSHAIWRKIDNQLL